jgi:colanic acid/amylovoran biosynthesis protein
MKICVMGTPISSGNRGVLALGASIVSLCLEADPTARFTFLLGHNRAETVFFKVAGSQYAIPVVPCRLSPGSRIHEHLAWIMFLSVVFHTCPPLRPAILRANTWIRSIAEADIVGDIRGGDSFSDLYGLKRFLLGFMLAWSVLLVKGRIVQFPQTYGPYRSRFARGLARYVLRKSSAVIARDKQSQAVAQELIGQDKSVLLSPDVAFSLEAVLPSEIVVDPPLKDSKPSRIIGLNVNGLMYNGGYTRDNMFGLKLEYSAFLTLLAETILRKTDAELWIIPHVFAPIYDVESDPEASLKLRNSLPPSLRRRVRLVSAPYNERELKGIIGICDFFVGSRMHSCIAALSQGVPCVGVAYSMKFGGVFESVGMQDWVVDGRKVGSHEAVKQILELYSCRDQVRGMLASHANDAVLRLKNIFQNVICGSDGNDQVA